MGITALVVDDDIVIQTIHRKLLQRSGIENTVVIVGNGKEAVDLHFSGSSFDLILMDLDMPIMDGIEGLQFIDMSTKFMEDLNKSKTLHDKLARATRKLRAMGIGSTIVGVSSWPNNEKVKEFLMAGLNDYHQKPLTPPMLNAILQKVNRTG